jgi:protocatechuate 3,4-dioxygenase beta subunit
MRKLGRLLLLAALAAAVLLAWRARRSSLRPTLAPSGSATNAGAAARQGAKSTGKPAGASEGGVHPGAVLAGRVVRADTGQPVSGAIVDLREGLWGNTTSVSGAEGRFRLEGLQPGTYRPRARVEGLYGLARESVDVEEARQAGEITIAVHPVASLRGRMELAGTSAPCPGGVVELQSDVTGEATATADGAGEVVFPALLPGRYDVRLTCTGHAHRAEAAPVELGDAARVVKFTVTEQLGISGIVVDETDTPPSGPVNVEAERVGEDEFDLRKQVTSGGDGSFDLWGLQPGTYRLHASVHHLPVARERPGPRRQVGDHPGAGRDACAEPPARAARRGPAARRPRCDRRRASGALTFTPVPARSVSGRPVPDPW